MYVGGKLLRLIHDNFYNTIHDSLDALDWFDTNRRHRPISMRPEPIDSSETIEPNLITVSQEDVISTPAEMGSQLAEHRYLYYIDVYAENRSLALDLSGDIKDILEGRYHSIGRTASRFEVLDLSAATPVHLFDCQIEDVSLDRSRYFSRPFEKYWWVITCDLVFAYSNDNSSIRS